MEAKIRLHRYTKNPATGQCFWTWSICIKTPADKVHYLCPLRGRYVHSRSARRAARQMAQRLGLELVNAQG